MPRATAILEESKVNPSGIDSARPDPGATPGALRPARVLLAEDDREMRRLLALCLRRQGYTVTEVENGIQLFERLEPSFRLAEFTGRIRDFDVIISDIRMPGLTGMEILGGLRKIDRETPIILITAFGDEETHAEAAQLGLTIVVDKPFDVDGFVEVLQGIQPPVSVDVEEPPPP